MPFPTKEELLALWRRTTPRPILDSIAGKPGEEVYFVPAAVMAYLGLKLDSALRQLYFSTAQGPSFALGELTLYWDADLPCRLRFEAFQLTWWGLKHGGKTLVPYLNTNPEPIEIDPGAVEKSLTLPVRAARAGADQDVWAKCLTVPFHHGVHTGEGASVSEFTITAGEEKFTARDLFRIVQVYPTPGGNPISRQITEVDEDGNATVLDAFPALPGIVSWEVIDLAEAGLYGENEADIVGGNFYNLDLLSRDRFARRKFGESDELLRLRSRQLADSVSPAAITRALKRLLQTLAPGYAATFKDCLGDPEMAGFGSLTADTTEGLAPNKYWMFGPDPRANPALIISRQNYRAYFRVVVPAFDPPPPSWEDEEADRARAYKIIGDTLQALVAGGVRWTMRPDVWPSGSQIE
ncbi:MAG: hypothetical protein C4523_17765 [Myxococcales bacterium]|nr:MAG: hypothetical protein C4523_17765 [Myxococcales bacterium]